jgi:DNA helicase-2/ATP-dependent DNA helicase PcrA
LSDYLNTLNEPQRQAVECIKGPVMIIAGAGSGKTRVLTYRIAHMLKQGVDPFNILALTFTNKAAKEMKERIVKVVGKDANNLWMGTFHSVFAKILRFEAEKLGYPSNFTIYDNDDTMGLLKDIIKEQGLDDKMYKPNLVYNRISTAKNNLCSVKQYQESVEIQNDDKFSGKPKLGLLYELYVKRCFKAGAMDFDDLLYKTYILLNTFPEVLHKYQHKFKYMMVDEFQDTNFAQYSIIKKLAAMHENICVVGDDAQSIYGFRGADIQNILNFEKDYSDLQIFKLEQNYRSSKTIVHAANAVILNNRNQLKKDVWTDNDHGDRIRMLRALSDNEEGMQVANAIFEDKVNYQQHNSDFAILYRTNAQSRSMEEALRKLNIPYRIYGGLSFYKRKEIKDVLAYFRLAINHNDEEALKRINNYPARGIGKTSLDRLIVMADSVDTSIWNLIENQQQYNLEIGSAARASIADFVAMIKSFAVMMKSTNAYEVASHIATATGLLRDLFSDKTPEGLSRYENIQELLNGIKEFTEKEIVDDIVPEGEDVPVIAEKAKTLDVYMQDIALLTDADNDDKNDNNKVSLMTIHAAKGLEFKGVFVVGLEENLFPSQMSINSRDDLEEERRLFYVAITRAEKKLTLSYATSRYRWGTLTSCEPSRFLEEIGPEFLELKPAHTPKQTVTSGSGSAWSGSLKSPAERRANAAPSFNPAPKPALKPTTAPAYVADPNFMPDDTTNLQAGMEVEHQRFGMGKVLLVEGSGADRKATIFFQGQGQKQLLLKFAKLKIHG